jgi:hypothetical protein
MAGAAGVSLAVSGCGGKKPESAGSKNALAISKSGSDPQWAQIDTEAGETIFLTGSRSSDGYPDILERITYRPSSESSTTEDIQILVNEDKMVSSIFAENSGVFLFEYDQPNDPIIRYITADGAKEVQVPLSTIQSNTATLHRLNAPGTSLRSNERLTVREAYPAINEHTHRSADLPSVRDPKVVKGRFKIACESGHDAPGIDGCQISIYRNIETKAKPLTAVRIGPGLYEYSYVTAVVSLGDITKANHLVEAWINGACSSGKMLADAVGLTKYLSDSLGSSYAQAVADDVIKLVGKLSPICLIMQALRAPFFVSSLSEKFSSVYVYAKHPTIGFTQDEWTVDAASTEIPQRDLVLRWWPHPDAFEHNKRAP